MAFGTVGTIAARGITDTAGLICRRPTEPARPAGGRRWIGRIVAVAAAADKPVDRFTLALSGLAKRAAMAPVVAAGAFLCA